MESFDQAWELICDYCQSKITDVAYKTWFSRLKPVSLDFGEGVAIIEAPNDFHKQTLLRCYSDLLKEAFDNVFGGGISFQICVHEELKPKQQEPDPFLQEDYELTFDTFVVGPSNRFAHAACQAVAAKPALLYNPLFIYGSSGLGKTHLLNAVAKEFKKNFPDRNVIYAKSEDFTNEIIAAWPRASYCWAVMFRKSPSDLLPFCTCMVRVMDSMAPRAMVATEVKRRAVRAMASTAMRFLVRLAAKLRRVSSFSIGFMWFSPSLLLLRTAYQGNVTFPAHLWYTFVPFGSNFSPAKKAPGWGPLGREGLRPPPGRPEGG